MDVAEGVGYVLLLKGIGNRLTEFDTPTGVLMKSKVFSDTLLNRLINTCIYTAYLPTVSSKIY
jgi:hypothetical protein